MIEILKSNLDHVFGEHSDTNVLRVFVNLFMNYSSMIDGDFLSYIYEQSEMQTYERKLMIHPRISTLYLRNKNLFTDEMIGTLLDHIYECSHESSGYLYVALAILKDSEDESVKEITNNFISTIKLDSEDEQNFYNFRAFLANSLRILSQ